VKGKRERAEGKENWRGRTRMRGNKMERDGRQREGREVGREKGISVRMREETDGKIFFLVSLLFVTVSKSPSST